jgi:hypothetical protein
MIISNINYLELLGENTKLEGGSSPITLVFNTTNYFKTLVNSPTTGSNSAAAVAVARADNNSSAPTSSYTKADTVAVTEYLGGSFSASTSVAVINHI